MGVYWRAKLKKLMRLKQTNKSPSTSNTNQCRILCHWQQQRVESKHETTNNHNAMPQNSTRKSKGKKDNQTDNISKTPKLVTSSTKDAATTKGDQRTARVKPS